VGLMGEAIWSRHEVRGPEQGTHSLTHFAWQAAASVALTGERASFKGLVPERRFDPKNGDWGAFELTARVSGLSLDDAAFTEGLAAAGSAERALLWTVGLNWALDAHVSALVNFERTSFESPAGTPDVPTETAVLTRLQFQY